MKKSTLAFTTLLPLARRCIDSGREFMGDGAFWHFNYVCEFSLANYRFIKPRKP